MTSNGEDNNTNSKLFFQEKKLDYELEDYKIETKLGEGTFGIVKLAINKPTNEKV